MGKLYTKNTPKGDKLKELRPKRETISFLLNYSRVLRITEYDKRMKFDTILN